MAPSGPYRTRLKLLDPNCKPSCNEVKEKIFNDLKIYFTQLIVQNNGFIAVVSKSEYAELLLSKQGEKTLKQLKLAPVIPPKVRAQRTVVFKKCDHSILENSESDILENVKLSMKQGSWMTINKVTKFHNSKTCFKIEFGDNKAADRVIKEGIYLFHFHVPHYNCEREIFHDIKTCFRCYKLEDHHISKCDKPASYVICSECSQLGHKYNECPNKDKPKCINCNGSHGTTSMKCPERKSIIKSKINQSKKTYSQVAKTPAPNQSTIPSHPQSFNLMSILVSAHMHNLGSPGEFNDFANKMLKENGQPAVRFPTNPNSAAILSKLYALNIINNNDSTHEPNPKINHEEDNNENEEMETGATPTKSNKTNGFKRSASESQMELSKKMKKDKARRSKSPGIAVHPSIDEARRRTSKNHGPK